MFTGMLLIFAPLIVGYLLPISSKSHLAIVDKCTSYMIYLILSLMGLSLASLDNFNNNIQSILLYTSVFYLVIAACNLASLPLIDKCLPVKTQKSQKRLPISLMMLESIKLLLVVGLGLAAGLIVSMDLSWVDTVSEGVLLVLLFFIGIQLGNSGLTLRQILLNKHGLLIALVVVLSSWLGGVISALILGLPLNKGLAMASGFGWYSLAGILMGDAYGPVFGGVSFLLELLRELLALVMIPMLINKKPCTSIGYAGATAMDFTLPIIQTSGGVHCIPIAIVSGFILSLLVPVFMLFFVSIGG